MQIVLSPEIIKEIVWDMSRLEAALHKVEDARLRKSFNRMRINLESLIKQSPLYQMDNIVADDFERLMAEQDRKGKLCRRK